MTLSRSSTQNYPLRQAAEKSLFIVPLEAVIMQIMAPTKIVGRHSETVIPQS
jgi:hypothetical protein